MSFSPGEPRRSGRATKGQHTKNSEADSPPKNKKRGGKGKKQGSGEPDDDDDEDDSIIRCLCGATEDEDGWMMISCEKCTAWQHNLCMDVTEDDNELSKIKYFCEQCKPENHKELLAAMARGEKPWEERIAKREETEKSTKGKKGKKGKGGRQSGAASLSKAPSAASSPQPVEAGTKRKFDSFTAANGAHSSPLKSPVAHEPQTKRTKSVSETRRTSTPKTQSTEDLNNPVVKALIPEIRKIVEVSTKDGSYSPPLDSSLDSIASKVAVDIELSLRNSHQALSPTYNSQFRAIIFNAKKNPSLIKRILTGQLTADELSTMSSDNMASDELQKERAAIKEETDKQATLAHEEGPRYRKTHKGEELITEDNIKPQSDNNFVAPLIRRRTTEDVNPDAPIDTGSPPPGAELPEDYDRQPRHPAATATTPVSASSEFNIQKVWKNVKPSDPTKGGVLLPRRHLSTSTSHQDTVMQEAGDSEIDRLLQDDDDSVPPTTSNRVVWRGNIFMNNVGSFSAIARFGCGGGASGLIPFPDLFETAIEIDGRIKIEDVESYVANQKYNSSMDVCGLAVVPTNTDQDRQGFETLHSYLTEKSRWGVITRAKHHAIHDLYIAPVHANSESMPSFVNMFEINEMTIPYASPIFLLILVSRKNVGPATTASGTTGPPHTPVNPHGPGFSPVAPNSAFEVPAREIERAILGPYIEDPVAKQLIAAVQMTETQLQNMRDILHHHPDTRGDLVKFSQHVEGREKGSVF
jgi:hypothetical protein